MNRPTCKAPMGLPKIKFGGCLKTKNVNFILFKGSSPYRLLPFVILNQKGNYIYGKRKKNKYMGEDQKIFERHPPMGRIDQWSCAVGRMFYGNHLCVQH